MNDLADICRRPIGQLLPHRPPMVFLDRACGMEGESFKATVRITPESPMFAAHGVPSWVGLEYMAQTVAAYCGADGLSRGHPVSIGMLLGTRHYQAAVPEFPEGAELDVLVMTELAQDNGVRSMRCLIRDAQGRILAHANITVIQTDDIPGIQRRDAHE